MTKKFFTNYHPKNRWIVLVWMSVLCLSSKLHAQQLEDLYDITSEYETDLHVFSLYGENHLFPNAGNYAYNFGTRLDLQAGRVGFYYKIGLGGRPDGKLYMHIPLGLQVGIVIAGVGFRNGNAATALLIPALLCAIVPEGITVRLWQRNNFNLKVYCSPWGSELNFSKEHFTLISGEAGIQGTIISKDRYNVSCYAGAKVIYKNLQPAGTIGATVGILLD